MKGISKGPRYLYSVWRNSDDRLMILDGTASQCAAALNIREDSFRRLVSGKIENVGAAYTITKVRARDVWKEEA